MMKGALSGCLSPATDTFEENSLHKDFHEGNFHFGLELNSESLSFTEEYFAAINHSSVYTNLNIRLRIPVVFALKPCFISLQI